MPKATAAEHNLAAPATPDYPIYQRLPSLVLGFHGCEKQVACKLLEVDGGIEHLKPSANRYDWLGNGVYFWENDPRRAWEFARERHTQFPPDKRGHIRDPFVIGAVIDLGLCLNLTDRRALNEVRSAHQYLVSAAEESGQALPKNTGREFGARLLDRAVIETVHTLREYSKTPDGASLALPPYDTVRSPFQEGDALYDGAGFQAKNHIQIAVRNLACIKGYFKPMV